MVETLPKYECKDCGASWIPRVPKPKQCPFCGSRHWDEPKEEKEE